MIRGRSSHKRMVAFLLLCCLAFCFYYKKPKVVGHAESFTEGKAECVIEASSGRVLYESHGDLRLPIASTTKILTAATVLQLCKDLQTPITIPQEAEGVEGSSVYLKSGDVYTVEELLYGLMLRSGNDCAIALALHCSGSVAHFTARMNETAQAAGALNSRFSNPHGLPCKNHYSTAKDMCYIAAYAMKNPIFREIVSTTYYAPRHWKNKNKMLTEYEGGIGVKTGYTKEAGRCLVSAAEKNGMTLISTVLCCAPMYERSEELLDDAFKAYRLTPVLKSGDTFTVKVGSKGLVGRVSEDFSYPMADGENAQLEYVAKPITAKSDKEVIGQIEIYLSKRLLFFGNLYKL